MTGIASANKLAEHYISIQSALVEAIRNHHVPWEAVQEKIRYRIHDALLNYSFIYSTNYDLLIYWSAMAEGGDGFKDYFWSESFFDLGNVKVWGNTTCVLYLHGGLHLCKTTAGRTLKRRGAMGANLLDQFGMPHQDEQVVPLFVAEGTSGDKLTSIFRSDYLSFAYSRLASHEGNLCIFGQSLGEEDHHIIQGIQNLSDRSVAISVRPGADKEIIAKKAAYIKCLPDFDLRFYDSTTHPLGCPSLRVDTGAPS